MVITLIIDDEPLARQRLRSLLLPYASEVTIAGECRNGAEAIDAIRRTRPDLIFLDIQMKDMTGFDVLNDVSPAFWPLVIFVTAYDQYALRAFDVFAFDYLLKPVKEERFHRSMQKALEDLRRPSRPLQAAQRQAAEAFRRREAAPAPALLAVRLAGRTCFVDPAELQYIKASGYYIELKTVDKKYLVRETLTQLLERLDPAVFLRIHRSAIINRQFLQEINHLGSGDVEVLMRDGQRLRVSRSCKADVFRALGLKE